MSDQPAAAADSDGLGIIVNLLLSGILVFATIYEVTNMHRVARLNEASSTWPATEGRIFHRTVEPSGSHSPLYPLHVKYRYTVDGVNYECDRIQWTTTWTGKADYERTRKQTPDVDIPCVVYYNPTMPAVACLVRQVPDAEVWRNYLFMCIAILGATGLLLLARPWLIALQLREMINDLSPPSE